GAGRERRGERGAQLGDWWDTDSRAPRARAGRGDPSLRVRQAAGDAIDSIREANGSAWQAPPPAWPGSDPWGGGFLPGDPNAEMIDSWFRQYLGRSVDPASLSSRLMLLRRGADPLDMEAEILGSAEYWQRRGGNVVGFI